MSANLAIDTNVLLLADKSAACLHILRMVEKEPNEYCLFLDKDRKIDREYQHYAKATKERDPEATIVSFVSWLFEGEDNKELFRLQSKINGRDLFPEHCQASAEAALVGISCGQHNFYLVITDDQHAAEEPIKRCYRDGEFLELLKSKMEGKPLEILPAHQYDQLRELTRPNIASYDQLRAFLERHRVDVGSAERTAIELKCPDKELNDRIIDDVMQALCGMLNSLRGRGYIFIGVKDGTTGNLCLKGVPRSYDGRERDSWDELKRIITDRWRKFSPQPNRVEIELIEAPDDSKRGILFLFVRPGQDNDRSYTYEGKKYIRIGERTQRIDSSD